MLNLIKFKLKTKRELIKLTILKVFHKQSRRFVRRATFEYLIHLHFSSFCLIFSNKPWFTTKTSSQIIPKSLPLKLKKAVWTLSVLQKLNSGNQVNVMERVVLSTVPGFLRNVS